MKTSICYDCLCKFVCKLYPSICQFCEKPELLDSDGIPIIAGQTWTPKPTFASYGPNLEIGVELYFNSFDFQYWERRNVFGCETEIGFPVPIVNAIIEDDSNSLLVQTFFNNRYHEEVFNEIPVGKWISFQMYQDTGRIVLLVNGEVRVIKRQENPYDNDDDDTSNNFDTHNNVVVYASYKPWYGKAANGRFRNFCIKTEYDQKCFGSENQKNIVDFTNVHHKKQNL